MNIFSRINIEYWQHVLSIVSLMLFFCMFIIILVRSIGMPSKQLHHMEELPLEGDDVHHE